MSFRHFGSNFFFFRGMTRTSIISWMVVCLSVYLYHLLLDLNRCSCARLLTLTSFVCLFVSFFLSLYVCGWLVCLHRSRALAIASLARSSSPGSTVGFVAFWPIGLSVSAMSSLSIFSRVVRVSSSTSAALRWAVGIGGRTIIGPFQRGSFVRSIQLHQEYTGRKEKA